MVDDKETKPQADGEMKNETPLFIRILQSGPYSIGVALVGGTLLYAAAQDGLLWLVCVGVCFLVPFGLFLSCLVVQTAACILWRLINWR